MVSWKVVKTVRRPTTELDTSEEQEEISREQSQSDHS